MVERYRLAEDVRSPYCVTWQLDIDPVDRRGQHIGDISPTLTSAVSMAKSYVLAPNNGLVCRAAPSRRTARGLGSASNSDLGLERRQHFALVLVRQRREWIRAALDGTRTVRGYLDSPVR